MPSFWVDPLEVYGDKVILLGDEAHHLAKVRRCSDGDVIDVTNGRGDFFKVRLEEITSERVEGVIVEHFILFLLSSLVPFHSKRLIKQKKQLPQYQHEEHYFPKKREPLQQQ